jgi:hypothetical protein
MKFMVLNSSGSVGKSTITRELLAPRLNNPLIIEVEGQNLSSKDFSVRNKYFDLKVFNNNFDELYLDLIENDDVIVDVGASQLEVFFSELDKIAGVETLFDYFIVPTIPTDKAQTDTIKTITFLLNKGIDADKIKIIFNAVKDVESDFAILIKALENINFAVDKELYISDNKVFQELGLMKKTLADVYNPDLNFYKSKILNETDKSKKLAWVKIDMANRLGHTAIDEMDFVFEKITGQKSHFKEKFGGGTESDGTDEKVEIKSKKEKLPKKESKKIIKKLKQTQKLRTK